MRNNCEACGAMNTDRAHIIARGWGNKAGWEEHATMNLCRWHHVQQGQIGWFEFSNLYPNIKVILENKGYEFYDLFGIVKLRKVK